MGAAMAPLAGLRASASQWPTKPIRVIVPYAAGSATDLIPRTVFEAVSAQVGQPVVVENRLGGGTTVGTSAAAKAEPDGHTILVHSNGLVTVPAIQPNVPYDPVRDFSGITPLGNVPLVLVVAPEKNIATVEELVAAARAKPEASRPAPRNRAMNNSSARSCPGQAMPSPSPVQNTPKEHNMMLTPNLRRFSGTRDSGR